MHCEWRGKHRITLVNVGHHIIHCGSWDLKNVMIHGGFRGSPEATFSHFCCFFGWALFGHLATCGG